MAEDSVFEARSPGAMLRAAREAQGLHLAALAAAIKVAPRKLEALEQDRWDELHDPTFTRALASTVCRALKLDAAPVVALLPRPDAVLLEPNNGGLGQPFRDRPGREDPNLPLTGLVKPLVGAAALLMVGAVALLMLPDNWLDWRPGREPVAVAASAALPEPQAAVAPQAPPASAASAVATEVNPTLALGAGAAASTAPGTTPAVSPANPLPPLAASAVSAVTTASTSAAVATGGAGGALLLKAKSATWVEVRDERGQVVFQRLLRTGETAQIDGRPPLKVHVGNVAGTDLVFRGQPVDLLASARDNVARVELR